VADGKRSDETRRGEEPEGGRRGDGAGRLAPETLVRQNRPDDPVVMHLQRQLANAFVLHGNYKRYHWQTYGPLFRDLHLLFDELAADVLGTLDELAERVRMIGQDPVAGPTEVVELATVRPAPLGGSLREMIEEADGQLLTVIREMRAAVGAAAQREDPGSADVFTRFVRIHEKHEWWLRSLLEKGDGLS
jgi:starvation-inducible DNA-binding protein